MKILVTGGAGFIGLKFSRYLKKRGYLVSIIDFKEKITKNMSNEFTCYGYDISKSNWIDDIKDNFDIVYHVAAQSGGRPSLDNPQLDCLWNCLGTVNVIEFCKKIKPKKLVYISSMAIYGNLKNANEKSTPNPISYYGVSKLTGEYYTKLLLEHESIPYTIYRLFATYGYGQDMENLQQGIVSIYIKLALTSNIIGITGKKDRIRQVVHINDVCDALYLAIINKKTNNEIYNVVHEEICTPKKIIDMISKKMKKELDIKELNGYIGDQTYITGSNKKLKSIGWRPKFNLEKGVSEFLEKLYDK
jgi:UDP-glucose 4-epimerase